MALTIGANARRKSGKRTEYVRKDELLVDGKVKPELLPDTTHEKTDIQQLTKRVENIEEDKSIVRTSDI